jgi:hypothetical protein
LIRRLEELVRLQKLLLRELKKRNPGSEDLEVILDFPRSGTVKIGDAEWLFRRHGVGMWFEKISDGTVVDVHKNVAHPDIFDVWRVDTYLRSIGAFCANETCGPELENLEANQKVVRVGDSFELANSGLEERQLA